MQLEENSEEELSKLRGKISQLNVENKSLTTRLKNNAEQSELWQQGDVHVLWLALFLVKKATVEWCMLCAYACLCVHVCAHNVCDTSLLNKCFAMGH